MMDKPEKATVKYLDAADNTLDWAATLLTAEGSFAGAPDDVGAYYKAPRAFAISGRIAEAQRVLRYVAASFYADGDFNTGKYPSAPASSNYRNAWLCLGSHTAGSYHLSYRAADYLQSTQHPRLGGVPDHFVAAAGDRQLEWGATAVFVVAMLAVGRIDSAVRAGDFLLDRMLDDQPDAASRLLLRKDWSGEWITDHPVETSRQYVIELGEPGQTYWYLGIGMAALGQLHLATGERRFFDAAESVFDLALKCRPGAFEDLTSAKVGWGCAAMYAISGDERYAEAARAVGDMLVRTQEPVGIWVRRPQIARLEDQPLMSSIDTSLERVCWLYEITGYLDTPPVQAARFDDSGRGVENA